MREIKFRVWDNVLNHMEYNDLGAYCSIDGEVKPCYDHVFLMQYTGLKDKNGKEIYESDLLKIKNGASEFAEEFIARVEYRGSAFALVKTISNNNIISDTIPWFINQTGEVIGNIYENN